MGKARNHLHTLSVAANGRLRYRDSPLFRCLLRDYI
nr:MAG TPA: hypothetical protein [Caudoviricetes sp.]